MTLLTFHTVEARSARISATLDARPELGAMWRRLVSLSEATANLSMEDVPVPEYDILSQALGSSMVSGDPQSAQIARQIHSFLLRPGDILSEPGDLFDRAIQIGRLTSLVDEESGGRIAYDTAEEKSDWATCRQEFEQASKRILKHDAPVIFRLLSFSSYVSLILPERVPIAERLIFMAAESALRNKEMLSDPFVGRLSSAEFDFRIKASWTLTPSIALSRGGFRAWSPASDTGRDTLVQRLNSALDYNVGHLAQLNSWMQDIEAFTGKNKKSRKGDFSKFLLQAPIISAENIAEGVGITARSARQIMDDAADRNLVTLLTPRRSYRLWAVPVLAKMIRERPPLPRKKTLTESLETKAPTQDVETRQIDRYDNRRSISAAEEELNEAMAKADRILAKYGLLSDSE
jgi:hypothetical protein